MAICRNCGNKLEDGVKFCPTCGTAVIDSGAKYCTKCGNERKGTEKFCSQCGTPYGQSPTNYVSEQSTNHSKKSKKVYLITAIVAAIVLAIGGAAWYFFAIRKDYSLEGLAKAALNYDYIDNFHYGLARVDKGEKYGFIDKMGNEIIPCIYERPERDRSVLKDDFHDGLAFVRQGDKCFFINTEGKEAFPYNYDGGFHFSEGLAVVRKDGKIGYIDTKGNEVVALTDKFHDCYPFSDGMAAVTNGEGKWGFINTKGDLVIPMNFDEQFSAPSFHEGFALIRKNEKYVFIDKSGKEIITCNSDRVGDFSEGLAFVEKGGKFGFIDYRGNEVIPCIYSSVESFSEGLAYVLRDDRGFYIDKNGNEIFSVYYDYYSFLDNEFHEGLTRIGKQSGDKTLYGFADKSGKEIIPCIYTWASHFSEGLALVVKDDVFGFVDKDGNSTFDVEDEEVRRIVQAKIQEKEEERRVEEERIRQEEQKRAEEERRRIEEERRRGVEKIVTLSCAREDNYPYNPKNLYGNYGAFIPEGMWRYAGYVMSEQIQVPNGKTWIYEKSEVISGGTQNIMLFYYSKESGARYSGISGIRYYDKACLLSRGDVPIIRSGDKFIVGFYLDMGKETRSIKVYFKEKDEDLVY